MLVLLFTISLVLVAEMFNSAIEAVVDLVSPEYNPLAKFAKDIAAGAVLISTIIALVVGSLMMLGENRWEALKINLTSDDLARLDKLAEEAGAFEFERSSWDGEGLYLHCQTLDIERANPAGYRVSVVNIG